jgi:hypothetical protein
MANARRPSVGRFAGRAELPSAWSEGHAAREIRPLSEDLHGGIGEIRTNSQALLYPQVWITQLRLAYAAAKRPRL